MTSQRPGQVELHQSKANALQLPILIAVVVLAVMIRDLFPPGPSPVVQGICGAALLLNLAFATWVMRNVVGTLLVTPDTITFSRNAANATPQVIHRADASVLTFRMAANGPFGGDHTGYVLKLRDTATGGEVFAGAFGRQRVRQACESQGWSFS